MVRPPAIIVVLGEFTLGVRQRGTMADEGERKTAGIFSSEDWLAIWLGGLILAVALAIPFLSRPADYPLRVAEVQGLTGKLGSLRDAGHLAHDRDAEDELHEQTQLDEKQLDKLQKGLVAAITPAWLARPGDWRRQSARRLLQGRSDHRRRSAGRVCPVPGGIRRRHQAAWRIDRAVYPRLHRYCFCWPRWPTCWPARMSSSITTWNTRCGPWLVGLVDQQHARHAAAFCGRRFGPSSTSRPAWSCCGAEMLFNRLLGAGRARRLRVVDRDADRADRHLLRSGSGCCGCRRDR